MIPRVERRVDDNRFHRKVHDPSLRIGYPGRLGAEASDGKIVDATLAEEAGWLPQETMDPRLLLAAHGGYAHAMEEHLNCVSTHEALADNVAVIKSVLDMYTRPSDFAWVMLSNGSIALTGEFDVPDADALRVRVDCHRMLDPKTIDEDVEVPALRVGTFYVQKKHFENRTIAFSEDMQLVGLSAAATPEARRVAQDAALSFLRPSGNRSRVLSVSVEALECASDEAGSVISQRLFDIEYRWRDLEREKARFDGSAAELNGDLVDRAEAVVSGIKQQQVVAAVVSHATRAVPHNVEALASRLKRYDDQLVLNPSLMNQAQFLTILASVSSQLLPLLKQTLSSSPEKGEDREFVNNYNICARYAQQPLIHV